ncbi:MAG: hypothetical protein CMJ83_10130 [Planctomycetes bacterium]|jgi:hypothetical protein|nr:hypothetical protein [Planctomycetota bacterium]
MRWVLLTAAVALALSLFLFAWDADGAFLVHDPLFFAVNAETRPWSSLIGHHPAFHVLVNFTTAGARACGLEHPGHVGVRVVSGLGAAAIVLLLAAIAGPGRRGLGAAFALPLLATRGFLLEAGAGENVLPACAAGLAALWFASRAEVGSWKVGIALVVALVLRQDNILILPGVLTAFAMTRSAGERWRGSLRLLAGAGLAALGLYLVGWWISAPELRFDHYLFHMMTYEWMPVHDQLPSAARFADHFAVSGVAVVGLQGPPDARWMHVLVGIGFCAAMLAAGSLLRGRDRTTPFAISAIVVLAVRAPFYAWFEPHNFEWWMLSLVVIVGASVATARGEARFAIGVRRLAIGLLVVLTAAILAWHLPWTLRLQDRTLARARDDALELGKSAEGCRYFAYRSRAEAAFVIVGAPVNGYTLKGSPEEAMKTLGVVVGQSEGPVVLLLDRFIYMGTPYGMRHGFDPLARFVMDEAEIPGRESRSEKGRVRVLGWRVGGG